VRIVDLDLTGRYFLERLEGSAGGRFRCDSIMIANDKFDDRTIN